MEQIAISILELTTMLANVEKVSLVTKEFNGNKTKTLTWFAHFPSLQTRPNSTHLLWSTSNYWTNSELERTSYKRQLYNERRDKTIVYNIVYNIYIIYIAYNCIQQTIVCSKISNKKRVSEQMNEGACEWMSKRLSR